MVTASVLKGLNTEELLEIYEKLLEKSWVDKDNNQIVWVVGK